MSVQSDIPTPGVDPAEIDASAIASAPLTAEAQETADQIQIGIEYAEKFTLEEALAAYNANLKPFTHPETGETVKVEDQRIVVSNDWLAKRVGEFKLRRPSSYDHIWMRTRYCELTRNLPVDGITAQMTNGIIVCERLLVAKPNWFSLEEMNDLTPVTLIYSWYLGWLARFRDES